MKFSRKLLFLVYVIVLPASLVENTISCNEPRLNKKHTKSSEKDGSIDTKNSLLTSLNVQNKPKSSFAKFAQTGGAVLLSGIISFGLGIYYR